MSPGPGRAEIPHGGDDDSRRGLDIFSFSSEQWENTEELTI